MEFGDCTRVYKEHNHGVHQIFENRGLGFYGNFKILINTGVLATLKFFRSELNHKGLSFPNSEGYMYADTMPNSN